MQLTFLEAGDTHPCNIPLPSNAATSSNTVDVTTIEDFYTTLCGFTNLNFQLLKGSLTKAVDNESWDDKYNNYSMLHWLCIESPTLPTLLDTVTHIQQGDRYYVLLDSPLPAHAASEYVRTMTDEAQPHHIICSTDEPDIVLCTKDLPKLVIDPTLLKALNDIPAPPPPDPEINHIAFINRKTDTYYAGDIDIQNRTHDIHQVASKDRLLNFLKLRGEPTNAPIPEWDINFNPRETTFIDVAKRSVNMFKPSKFLLNATKLDITSIPPKIDAILESLTGGDAESKDHFINWLAFRFQTRMKTGTAWVFTGTQGTGKGLLFNRILAPLFGEEHCRLFTLENLAEGYNSYAETALFVGVDEAHVANDRQGQKLLDKLKTKITEPKIELRKMRTNLYTVDNHCDYIFFSNHRDAMRIVEGDRRFNVAPHQTKPLPKPSEADIAALYDELQDFANYLQSYHVNDDAARTPLDNEHKRLMAQNSSSQHERFFRAIRDGDIDYLVECVEEPHYEFKFLRTKAQEIITEIINNIGDHDNTFISITDVSTLYALALGKESSTRHMCVWLSHNGFAPPVRRPRHIQTSGDRPRGLDLIIKLNDIEKARALDTLSAYATDTSIAPFERTPDANNREPSP